MAGLLFLFSFLEKRYSDRQICPGARVADPTYGPNQADFGDKFFFILGDGVEQYFVRKLSSVRKYAGEEGGGAGAAWCPFQGICLPEILSPMGNLLGQKEDVSSAATACTLACEGSS